MFSSCWGAEASSLPWPCRQLCAFLVRVDSPWSPSSCCCDWCLFCEPEQAAASLAPARPALCAQTGAVGKREPASCTPGDGQPFAPSQRRAVTAFSLLSPQQHGVMAVGEDAAAGSMLGGSPRLRGAADALLASGAVSPVENWLLRLVPALQGTELLLRGQGKG